MLGCYLKVMFWYEVLFILFLTTLIPLLSGSLILSLLIKKTTSSFINKCILIGAHYLASFALTCALVYSPAIFKNTVNVLNSGLWAIAVECVTTPLFFLTYKYRITYEGKNMEQK